jgi:hypothetical protein
LGPSVNLANHFRGKPNHDRLAPALRGAFSSAQENAMSNLSRRLLVASAAALPALAVPAIAEQIQAPSNVTADPIFAAIDRYDEAFALEDARYGAQAEAESLFHAKHDRLFPSGLTKRALGLVRHTNPYWYREHSQISELKGDLPADVIAEMHRELNSQTASPLDTRLTRC